MLVFATAVFFMFITPGPGVLSAAGVGSAFGVRPGVRYIFGLFLGTNLVALAVVTGLAALILTDPRVRLVLFTLSFAYLTYLAFRIALSGSRIAFIERAHPPGIKNGVILQILNPKAYAVNTALFTGFNFLPQSYAAEVALKFAITNAIWIPLHFLWLWAGVALQRLDLPERMQRRINMSMGAAMLAVVVLALLSGR